VEILRLVGCENFISYKLRVLLLSKLCIMTVNQESSQEIRKIIEVSKMWLRKYIFVFIIFKKFVY